MDIKADFPEKLQPIFTPSRYKVARGGRGSAKSWSFARALLIMGLQRKLRVLCAREVQLSIKQSVHKLLKDQIELLGLSKHYTVLEADIRGVNGTEFAFTGLSQLTVDTIKSFEGYDVCWVEEGQVISKRSWDILIPTIRKEASEIWISYNPELESDETHQRFTIDPPWNCINIEVNWRDNPWFSNVLNDERLHCKKSTPDDYDNIWEGKCRAAVEGAIFFKQIQEAEAQGRICNIPHDPLLRTHIVPDLGWEDSLTAALVQRHTSEIRIIEYLEFNHTGLDEMSAELKTRPYNWGRIWLPHDGFSGSLKSKGKSTYDILKALGWDVAMRHEITEVSIEEGIRLTRMAFPRMYFDKEKAAALKAPENIPGSNVNHTNLSHRLLECLKRYRRHINMKTQGVTAPVRDPFAHGADTTRYIALNADNMHNETDTPVIKVRLPQYGQQQQGWMA
jgi:phage terminase large subunit